MDNEIVFRPGSNSTQQLDSVIFMWGTCSHRDFCSGEEIYRNGKSQGRPTPTLVGRTSAALANVEIGDPP